MSSPKTVNCLSGIEIAERGNRMEANGMILNTVLGKSQPNPLNQPKNLVPSISDCRVAWLCLPVG